MMVIPGFAILSNRNIPVYAESRTPTFEKIKPLFSSLGASFGYQLLDLIMPNKHIAVYRTIF